MTHRNRAFSLVELSIVLIILGVVIAGILPIITRNQTAERERVTQERLEHIMTALEAHVIRYGSLPCPADPTANIINAALGVGTGTDTAGADNCTAELDDIEQNAGADDVAVAGAVPTYNLGLNHRFLVDGWGNRFSYIVDENLTACASYATEDPDIQLINESGDSLVGDDSITPWPGSTPGVNFDKATQGVAVVVISHGGEGAGHATAHGQILAGNGGTFENTNALRAAGMTGAFRLIPRNPGITATDHFDDIIAYRTKTTLPAPPSVCP